MPGHQGAKVSHQGLEGVVGGKEGQPPGRAQPCGKIVHALGQFTVADSVSAGEDGGAVAMPGKVRGKGDAGEFKGESHSVKVEDRLA